MFMRKFLCFAMSLLIALPICFSQIDVSAAEAQPTREINVVYDDSGSMISDIKNTASSVVDTWCQAKYSMEVFAAMLGDYDTMNIYVMSDYCRSNKPDSLSDAKSAHLSLSGSDGSAANVQKVHEMITSAADTPFMAVEKAANDLRFSDADEKWLVVLTDGAFQGKPSDMDSYFSELEGGIKVMFLGMGAEADSIAGNESKGIYSYKAENNSQILNNITEMCTRIFEMDKLVVDTKSNTVSFDIPMSELIVFAQGEGVTVSDIKAPNSDKLQGKNPVTVKYSETPTTNSSYLNNYTIDYGLEGVILTYSGDFISGEYKINASNATTIEVYYKPNVDIMAYLVDSEGNSVASTEGIESGDYTLKFGFVRKGTTEAVKESDLLGDISYSGTLTANGVSDGKEYHSGEKVSLEAGTYHVDVTADYLKYNTETTSLDFTVYTNREIALTVVDSPVYEIDKEGFVDTTSPIVVEATVDGETPAAEEWALMNDLNYERTSNNEKRIGLTLTKTSTPGVYNATPYLDEEKTSIGDYNTFDVEYSTSAKVGLETWSGSVAGEVNIKDLRPWFYRHIDKVIKIGICAIIFVILLGYLVKKRLPKRLKKAPLVVSTTLTYPRKTLELRGRYTKKMVTVIVPYVAERGTIKYVPSGVGGAPRLEVKAVGSNRMEITNIEKFSTRKDITFNGSPVPPGTKKMRQTAGLTIVYETQSKKYTCTLNRGASSRRKR